MLKGSYLSSWVSYYGYTGMRYILKLHTQTVQGNFSCV